MESMPVAELADLPELLSPEWVSSPFTCYAILRERTPLLVGNRWLVMRHEDVVTATIDTRTFSSDHGASSNPALRDTPIIFEDPPAHTHHRRLVNKAFTPRRVAAMEPWVVQATASLLDALESDEVDVVSAFCDPLPVMVIAEMIGVPSEEHAQFKEWSDLRSYLIGTDGTIGPSADDAVRIAIEANRRLVQYFADAAAERATAPRGDLVSDLVHAEVEGERLGYAEISGICALLLTAGNVTTTNLLSNLLHILANRPDIYERLRTDRSLVPAAIEEALRIEAPVQWMGRLVTRDVVLNDVTIPKGASVLLFYGAANRDPAVIAHPDEFDLANAEKGHLAFGHGIHFCIGAPLARLEARVAIEAFLDRYSHIELTDEPAIRISAAATHCGFDELFVRLRP